MIFFEGILKTFIPLQEVEASAKNCFKGNHENSQFDNDGKSLIEEESIHGNLSNLSSNEKIKNITRLECFIDWLVRCSGSKTSFCFIQICLLIWAFLGIPFNQKALWPIFISDAQAIVSYIFDTLLMRQQLKGFAEELKTIAKLRSSNQSKIRMMKTLIQTNPNMFLKSFSAGQIEICETEKEEEEEEVLLKRPLFERILTKIASIIGHIGSVGVFCLTILIWIAFGPKNNWNNQWQLYMNSASSAWMVFLFSLLAVVREGHSLREKESIKQIHKLDYEIEKRLRFLTGDLQSNQSILIKIPKQNIIQNIINIYAYIVGGLVGLFILIIVFAIWFAIGPVMSFNDNWWLLIGTYSGLIGMNDGFVLRNVQNQIESFESQQFIQVLKQDQELKSFINSSKSENNKITESVNTTLTEKISNAVCYFTAHQITVVVGLLSIIGMVIGASVLHWSLTGQLICNVPPSIIESLFMQILITGHIAGDKRKQGDILSAYKNRQNLFNKLKDIDTLSNSFVKTTIKEKLDQEQFVIDSDVIVEA